MSDITPDIIFQIGTAFMASKQLFVANEIGLFEQLGRGPATLAELATRTGVPPRTLRIIADGMVALGFLDRQDEHYQNNPVAATYLSGRTPADFRPFLRLANRLSFPGYLHFEEAVRAGRGTKWKFQSEEGKLLSEGIEVVTAGPAQALPTSYDFSRHQRVLDLGGGTGSFLLPLLTLYSHLEATCFEQPGPAELARQQLKGTPVGKRVKIVEGDFFQDPLPSGHDLILIANVLHMFSSEHNLELLQHVRRYAASGTRLLLVDFWTDPTHSQPAFAALMAGEFLLFMEEGACYSGEEVSGWLQECSWKVVGRQPLVGPTSLIVAEAL